MTLQILYQKMRLAQTQHIADFKVQENLITTQKDKENRDSQNRLLLAFNEEIAGLKKQFALNKKQLGAKDKIFHKLTQIIIR